MIKKIFTYGFGEIVVKAISFLALPLYSHLILPQEYGVLGYLNSLIAFLPFVFTFYYLYAYVRFSTEVNEKILISTYFFLGLFLNIFYIIVALILYFLVIQRYDINITYFSIAVVTSSTIFIFQIMQMYHRSKGLASLYIKSSLYYSVLVLILNFIFLLLLEDNVLAMLISATIVSFTASVVSFRILKVYISWRRFDLALVKKILRYTIPLIPGAIALLIYSQADKIILINYITKEELGVYMIAFTLALSMGYIGNAFFMGFQPLFYEKISSGMTEDIKVQYWKNILIIIAALCVSFVIIFIAYELVDIDYISGKKSALIIAIAYSFMTFSQIMELHLTYLNKTYLVSLVYGVGVLVSIVCLLLLIPLYGFVGASYSLFISSFFISMGMYVVAQKNLYINYNKYVLISFYFFNLSVGMLLI